MRDRKILKHQNEMTWLLFIPYYKSSYSKVCVMTPSYRKPVPKKKLILEEKNWRYEKGVNIIGPVKKWA